MIIRPPVPPAILQCQLGQSRTSSTVETSVGRPWPDQHSCTVLHSCKEHSGSDLFVCSPSDTVFQYVAHGGPRLAWNLLSGSGW